MKKTYTFITFLFATFCLYNNVKAQDSNLQTNSDSLTVVYSQPLGYISFIEEGNKMLYNDSLTTLVVNNLDSIIINNPLFSKNVKHIYENQTEKNQFEKDAFYLFESAKKSKKKTDIPLPDHLKLALKEINGNYLLITFVDGFERKKNNYGKQIAKGVGLGIATLGMVNTVPYKAQANLQAFLIRKADEKIFFYQNIYSVQKQPSETETCDKLFKNLRKHFNKLKDI